MPAGIDFQGPLLYTIMEPPLGKVLAGHGSNDTESQKGLDDQVKQPQVRLTPLNEMVHTGSEIPVPTIP
jgi:hypothetical protein